MSEVMIDVSEDAGTRRLARAEITMTILVQAVTLFVILDQFDDGTTWPTLVWHWRRFNNKLRHKLRGAVQFRVPAWPVIAEAERVIREAGVTNG